MKVMVKTNVLKMNKLNINIEKEESDLRKQKFTLLYL